MASPPEELSLLSRLEKKSDDDDDHRGLYKAFSDYLKPLSDFIDSNGNVDDSTKMTKKKSNLEDPKLIRPLAKQFLTFISRALKLLPNRLSEPPKPGGGGGGGGCGGGGEEELFDVYRLCLDCLSCISPCLDCKPFSMHFQRIRLVHCLETWGRYGDAECEGLLMLESIREISLVKEGKKKKKKKVVVEERLIPELGTENGETPELACLILEIVVSLVKCAAKGRSKDEAVYWRVLALVDQVRPWLRLLDSKALERLHRVLVTNLYKCTIFMLGEDAFLEGELLDEFCMTTLTECLKSYPKDQFLKFAHNICSSLRSQWVNRPSLVLNILQCVLDTIACTCKVGIEYTVNESLSIVYYCLKRCRIANMDTCKAIGRHLDKIAGKFVKVEGPIGSILRLYATGFHFLDSEIQLGCSSLAISGSLKVELAVTILLGIEEKLHGLLSSLASYFPEFSYSHSVTDHVESYSRSISCPAILSDMDCCKNNHGNISLLSYLNAMEFFFQPFTELVNKTCIQMVLGKEAASLSSRIAYVQDALHQFCNVFFAVFRCTSDGEKDRLNESRKILLNAAIAAFLLSLGTDKKVKESKDCIDFIVSKVLDQSKEIKFIVSSLYNVGADLYNAKEAKLASVVFEVCCSASWIRVSLLCKKLSEKSGQNCDDVSEEDIVGSVTDACAKSVILLDVRYHCDPQNLDVLCISIVDSISNWFDAWELFNNLDAPTVLVKKWVKIMCKEFKDVDVEDNVPTLYSLLAKPSSAGGKRRLSIILEQELLAYEELETQNTSLCQRMQLRVIDILLLHVYGTQDHSLQRSLMLIKKGRVVRACGEGLGNCVKCLSEAISVLVSMSDESSRSSAQISHQLALAYCLRALSMQEAQPNFEVNLRDIRRALDIWSSINWSTDVHRDLVIENAIPLLCCIADLLSLKGYLDYHYEIHKLMIVSLKRKSVPLEQCTAMLWADRRLTHALCASPVFENLVEHSGVHSNSVAFWISCIKDSPPLLIGFRQKFSLFDSIMTQVGHHPSGSPLGSDVTIDEVKEAASSLISRDNAPSSAFLAGYLYYDLSERLMSSGQLFEALLYGREAFRLRTKLLQKKFICTFRQQPVVSSETGESTPQHEHDYIHLEVFGSVASEAWPRTADPCKLGGCNLSQWNVLQCYLESVLQVGTINEATGNAIVAEALFLQGKHISSMEGLPIFMIAFASALGEIYYKKQQWDLADKELNIAKQILVDSSTTMSCKRCKLSWEVIIDQRIGDLMKGRRDDASTANNLSLALDFYSSALKKLNLPEWKNPLSFSEETTLSESKELPYLKAKDEGSHDVNIVSKKSRKSKNTLKHLPKEQNMNLVHKPMMTRSRYRCSNTKLQVEELSLSEYPKYVSGEHSKLEKSSMAEFGHVESCTKRNCWRCLLMKVMESGTMQDYAYMKWEYHRRRLSVRLLTDIGECTGVLGKMHEIHETHEIFWRSISELVDRRADCGTYSNVSHPLLLEFIVEERQGDIFAIERASILYNISLFSLKNHHQKYSRIACCDLSHVRIPMIVSWLLQAFILSRELPLLFQKVCRLLAVIFLLSTCGGPFSLPHYSGKVLSESHWAAYFHQASVGTYLNHQFLSYPSEQQKACDMKDSEGTHATCSNHTVTDACNMLRLAPERIDDLEKFVIDFFRGLPNITSICISLLGSEFVNLLRDIVPCHSFPAWILLSRLNANVQPVVMILPADSIAEEASDSDTNFVRGPISEDNPSKNWHCPWGYTIVDDVAPAFKYILEENYLSSSISPAIDSQDNRLLWWTWRRKLNDRLDKFLRAIEDSWFGAWKCLLLGEPTDRKLLDSVLSELIADLKDRCEFDGNENLLRSILGGSMSVPETTQCVSQLLRHKGYIGGGCCLEKKCGSPDAHEELGSIFLLPQQLILDAACNFGNESVDREPVVLVLDSEVQMLPWENLPVLRRHETYRMPSVGSISAILSTVWHVEERIGKTASSFPSIDPLDAFYLLNPSGDLDRTQAEFEQWFRDQQLEGKAGTAPTTEELVMALKSHDLFIYFGHGSGTQYIPGYEIQKIKSCAATLLMGCSSGCLSLSGSYNPQGAVLSYLLAGSPAIIANLWEVTDKDIDRFGKAMLNAWLQERTMHSNDCAQCSLIVKEFESMNIASSKGNTKRKVTRGKKLKNVDHSGKCKDCSGQGRMIGSFMSQARDACTLPLLIGASPVCYGVPTGIRKKKDL